MPEIDIEPLPPAEAIRFFESKGFQVGFDWRDVWQQEHARAFTVAKAVRYDVLEDIRRAVDTALREGQTLQQFKRDLTPILQAHGWWGRQTVLDSRTGELVTAQLGSPRRLQTIFDVNMRSARSAGRWARAQRTNDARPFLFYATALDERVRDQHRAWHAIVLPIDHEWWDTHYPPNGWRCRCIVMTLSQRDLERRGLAVSDTPDGKTVRFMNKRTGEAFDVPVGIDPGFAFNVGRAHMAGLAPPPRSGPLRTPAINPPPDTPMPPARRGTRSRLLPAGREEDFYKDRFLNEFGASSGKPMVFNDALGEPVVISEALFMRPDGTSKLPQSFRRQAMLFLADTIKDPDEIWWLWEFHRTTKQYRLRRRYFASFDIEGEEAPMLAAFDVAKDGWAGVTAFRPRTRNYLLRQRAGVLAYRRG